LALTTSCGQSKFNKVKVKERYHHGALRKALINEAFHVLEKGGLEAVSLRGLAASVGVSKTAPYRHFADKRELLMTLAAEGFGVLADTLENALSGASGPLWAVPDGPIGLSDGSTAGIRSLFRAYLEFARTRPALYRLMFSRLGFSLHSESCRINSARALSCLVRAVEKARSGGWRVKQETNALVLSLWAEVHGWAGLLIEDLIPSEVDMTANAFQRLSESLLE
jgi:AcrR family transcriptional regulator